MQADRKDLPQFFVQIVLFRKYRVDMTLDGRVWVDDIDSYSSGPEF